MIQRDYFLRMIEELSRILRRIAAHKEQLQWAQASATADEELRRLAGLGIEEALKLSETDLLARLIESEPAFSVRDKSAAAALLLAEAGDIAAASEAGPRGPACHLRALQLLLATLARHDPADLPACLPRVDALLAALSGQAIPPRTRAALAHHFERLGEFAQAENHLFALAEEAPGAPGLLELAAAYYRRLLARPDDQIVAGGLTRAEAMESLAEFQAKFGAAAQ